MTGELVMAGPVIGTELHVPGGGVPWSRVHGWGSAWPGWPSRR
jgi:hypothetical protein